jgi:hypothetical protein
MQFTAKLVQILPLQTGEGKNGPWKKQDIIVETKGEYPKKVCVSVWGDKMPKENLQPGSLLDISFDLESREFNGKWYSDVKAWKVEVAGKSGSADAPPDITPEQSISLQTEEGDDLPF